MVSLTNLDLPTLPMEDPGFAGNPFPYLAAARAKHPWLAKCAFGYVVHEFQAMRELLRQDDSLQPSYVPIVELLGAHGTPWGRFQESHMLSYTGADHKRLRMVLADKFTSRQADIRRPLMRETISAVLDEWVPKGKFDFEVFASFFPITVMFRLVGAPPEAIPDIRKSLEALGLSASMDRHHLPALQEATVVLDEYVQELVKNRRAGKCQSDQHDLLDDLLGVNDDGGLSDRELYDLLIFLFVAGYDTSKNMLTLIMNQMLDHPDCYVRCAGDPEYCKSVVEETLRYHSPGTIPRVTAEDFVYRDVLLPKGTMIFFPVSISGRDPRAVDDPDRFDPEREQKNRHLAFGRGIHICLGQFIARAQIEEGLHLIAQRIRNPRRAGPSGWRPFYGVWGLCGLPIEFDPDGSS